MTTLTMTLFLAKRKRKMSRQVLRNKNEVAIVQRRIRMRMRLQKRLKKKQLKLKNKQKLRRLWLNKFKKLVTHWKWYTAESVVCRQSTASFLVNNLTLMNVKSGLSSQTLVFLINYTRLLGVGKLLRAKSLKNNRRKRKKV